MYIHKCINILLLRGRYTFSDIGVIELLREQSNPYVIKGR